VRHRVEGDINERPPRVQVREGPVVSQGVRRQRAVGPRERSVDEMLREAVDEMRGRPIWRRLA
jgi:hypothetical protein